MHGLRLHAQQVLREAYPRIGWLQPDQMLANMANMANNPVQIMQLLQNPAHLQGTIAAVQQHPQLFAAVAGVGAHGQQVLPAGMNAEAEQELQTLAQQIFGGAGADSDDDD